MRSEVASTELGKAFANSFEVRFGPSLQADVILPGPPISWAFLFLEDLQPTRLLSAVARLDRMVAMFEHAVVVMLRPSPEGVIRLQQHLAESGKKHLGTKLLFFPDVSSAKSTIIRMCPMLTDVTRRRSQLDFIKQLRDDYYVGENSVLSILKQLICGGNEINDGDVLTKDANLLIDRFGNLASVLAFGKARSFRVLSVECPLEESTIERLDSFFATHDVLCDDTGGKHSLFSNAPGESLTDCNNGLEFSDSNYFGFSGNGSGMSSHSATDMIEVQGTGYYQQYQHDENYQPTHPSYNNDSFEMQPHYENRGSAVTMLSPGVPIDERSAPSCIQQQGKFYREAALYGTTSLGHPGVHDGGLEANSNDELNFDFSSTRFSSGGHNLLNRGAGVGGASFQEDEMHRNGITDCNDNGLSRFPEKLFKDSLGVEANVGANVFYRQVNQNNGGGASRW